MTDLRTVKHIRAVFEMCRHLGIDAVLPTFQCPNCGKLLVCQSTDIKKPKTAKKRFLAIFFGLTLFFPYFDRTILHLTRRHKIGHFGEVLPSQSLDSVLNKLNPAKLT